jgi:CrcB protein
MMTDQRPAAGTSIVLVVAAGGAIGAVARWLIERMTIALLDAEPMATLMVNVIGCLLMGALIARLLQGHLTWPLARPFLGTGVLGGFTTFSAYSADAVVLARDESLMMAGAYLVGTLVLCVLAVWAGTQWGRGRGAST